MRENNHHINNARYIKIDGGSFFEMIRRDSVDLIGGAQKKWKKDMHRNISRM